MAYQALFALAIDAKGTRRRENAVAVAERPDGWLLEVSLYDKDSAPPMPLHASNPKPRSFNETAASPAVVLSVVVKADGAWFLEGVAAGWSGAGGGADATAVTRSPRAGQGRGLRPSVRCGAAAGKRLGQSELLTPTRLSGWR